MREILFRGQTRRKGKKVRMDGSLVESNWVYGGVFQGPNRSVIYTYDPVDKRVVYSDTVGQFTGLTDKNGKRIFEGDIVQYNTFDDFDCYSVVKFGEYKQDGSAGEYDHKNVVGWYVNVDNFTCPDWAENDPTYFPFYLNQQNLKEVAHNCEVIGNIHDNPELL